MLVACGKEPSVSERAASELADFDTFWSFDDPAAVAGDELARLTVFRRVRDEIRQKLRIFVMEKGFASNVGD